MNNFAIIPDTACDLTADLRERYGIDDYLHGILYHPNGKEELASLDWPTMSAKEYYLSMKGRKALYKTASPPIGEVMDVFERHLQQGRDILSISLSAALSSSYANTVTVAEELSKKYPDRKIVCVDSMRYSTSLGLLVIDACEQRDAGKTLEETAAYLEKAKYTIHQMGSMDDLFFLVKTGRVTNFKAFFGQMIGLNLLADFNHKGMAEVIGKCKGQRDALDVTIQFMEQTIVDPENQVIFVAQTNREAASELLAQRIREKFHPREVIMTTVGMACGATIGPGLCAAFYHGKPITENLADEKALMEQLLDQLKK